MREREREIFCNEVAILGRVNVVRVYLNVFSKHLFETKIFVQAVTTLASIREEPYSNLNGDIDYPD